MSSELFTATPYSPPDAIFALKAAYDADTDPRKINLGPGAYLDDAGKPWILPCVAAAERHMAQHPAGHEYLPLLGLAAFRSAAARVVFGADSRLVAEGRVATIQTISGTGAVHLALLFLRDMVSSSIVYVSDPSWSNHRLMAEFLGMDTRSYPYYHAATRSVAFDDMLAAMEQAERGSVWILHPCAHNPTGCDLDQEQWRRVADVVRDRQLVPVLDCAYQGFASGDLDRDAWAIRLILEERALPGLVCQSFSKSMGMYGERVGALHLTVPRTDDAATAVRNIESQLGWLSRKEISVPPRFGATVAATVLNSDDLFDSWKADLETMSGRIAAMRQAVVAGLARCGTPGSWTHVTDQIGMFSYTGLTREHVARLRERHIYLADNGRISVSGLNTGNVEYFCQSVHEVVSGQAA